MRHLSHVAALLFAPLAVMAQSASTSPSTADRVLDRALAKYATVKTVRSTFEQTITNPLTRSSHTSRGESVQHRPSKLAITFSDPKGDRIVVDGKHVWVYTPSTTPGQVLRLPAGGAGAGPPDLVTEIFTNPRKRYTITSAGSRKVESRTLDGLTLIPLPNTPASETFASVVVWVDAAGLVREFTLTDHSGLTRSVKFTAMKVNPTLPKNAFVFVVPKGVRVFDGPTG